MPIKVIYKANARACARSDCTFRQRKLSLSSSDFFLQFQFNVRLKVKTKLISLLHFLHFIRIDLKVKKKLLLLIIVREIVEKLRIRSRRGRSRKPHSGDENPLLLHSRGMYADVVYNRSTLYLAVIAAATSEHFSEDTLISVGGPVSRIRP